MPDLMKVSEAILHLDRAEKAFEMGATEQVLIDVGRARAVLQCLSDCGEGPCKSAPVVARCECGATFTTDDDLAEHAGYFTDHETGKCLA